MYLKALELVGFKSFADRTRLEFAPGMTAIVGPNGCGKSNVSDAIRWVLGEQSAKLLRGSKMEDCIFNGTENRKPLGMAEVSLILADCEQVLGTEFNEVTVTRRVFRSGEGQYFLNKTPCRLRDIQRLFMDTGIGTSSYSLMEQGRIDLILSSRPEDRREVFEEAGGITKYKADKREAMRKLEQTEANLLRLADIIKEVRRQIISLQRQAGKAARYKKHQEELRRLDIFVTREKLQNMDAERTESEQRLEAIRRKLAQIQETIRQHENLSASLRERLEAAENEAGSAQQSLMELTRQRDQAQQTIEHSQRRILELKAQCARDAADAGAAGGELEQINKEMEESRQRLAVAEEEFAAAQADLQAQARKLADHEKQIATAKQTVTRLLSESMDRENRLTQIQNELLKIENENRNIASRRERCAAEQENLKLLLAGHQKRVEELKQVRAMSQAAEAQAVQELNDKQSELAENQNQLRKVEDTLAELRAERAAAAARLEILERNIKAKSGFSQSARKLLDAQTKDNLQSHVLGALAGRIEALPEYQLALETALRAWLDAVVVQDMPAALACLRRIEPEAKDALRLLAATVPAAAPNTPESWPEGTVMLRKYVKAPESLAPLMDRLLAGVAVVDDLSAIPSDIPLNAIYVTRQGVLVRGDGHLEIHRGGAQQSSPLANKHLQAKQRDLLANADTQLTACSSERDAIAVRCRELEKEAQQLRTALAEKQQLHARQEGEFLLVEKQANQVCQNLETVAWEMRELEKQGSSADAKGALLEEADNIRERRQEIRRQIETGRQEQEELEQTHRRLAAAVTDAQIRFAKQEEARSFIRTRSQPLAERAQQLQKTIDERQTRLTAYNNEIADLNQAILQAQTELPRLEEDIRQRTERLEGIQSQREQMHSAAKSASEQLQQMRTEADTLSRQESETNGKCVEQRMQRQYLIERVTGEHRISADAIQVEPEPEWPDQQRPEMEALELTIAELRAKLESMGSVNTDAIAEYKEQEERYQFLNSQQNDLLKSKQQLMDMIKTINQTTTEMFAKTFAEINENFQTMFKQLFGGGSAKLTLADEEDILECGIEIIARPPGKKLQSVSLLSGGERAMTAVALLFAIFMVKPSPFCVLDELDASLDESNIHRFIKVLQGFIAKSQFIIITHNRATISAANVLYGVTMAETGISKIVSMRFVDQSGKLEPAETSEKTDASQTEPANAITAER